MVCLVPAAAPPLPWELGGWSWGSFGDTGSSNPEWKDVSFACVAHGEETPIAALAAVTFPKCFLSFLTENE